MYKRYTPEDKIFLKNNYGIILLKHLALIMGHSQSSIGTTAMRLGIRSRATWRNDPKYDWDETFSAYLAGIIDGEGSVHFGKTGLKHIHFGIYIQMNHEETIKYLSQKLDIHYHLEQPRKGNQKISYKLEIHGLIRILRVLEKIERYLITKKEKAVILKEFCKSRLNQDKINTPYTKGELDLVSMSKQYNSGKGGAHA